MKGKDKESAAKKAKDLVQVAERAHKEAARKADAADEVVEAGKVRVQAGQERVQGGEQGRAPGARVADEARAAFRRPPSEPQKPRPAWQGQEEGGVEAEAGASERSAVKIVTKTAA